MADPYGPPSPCHARSLSTGLGVKPEHCQMSPKQVPPSPTSTKEALAWLTDLILVFMYQPHPRIMGGSDQCLGGGGSAL